MSAGERWAGIPTDRVVAVVAHFDVGRVQVGSGYLVTGDRVLTARHCTVDKTTGQSALSLRVLRLSDGEEAPASVVAHASDVAVLTVEKSPSWTVPPTSELPLFGRVDRSRSHELQDCATVGFPLWQVAPKDKWRNAAELHGTIRVTEEMESGLLVMRDPLLHDVAIPPMMAAEDRAEESEWGGMSGALVFHQGIALGVVIKHFHWKGGAALTILPVERFAAVRSGADLETEKVAAALGLPTVDKLSLAGGRPLAGLVDVLAHGRLPRMDELNPYALGATPSGYGNADTYGQRDEYVPRTRDGPLVAAVRPGHLVILVGPSKVGKTRTAFEALRRPGDWSHALLAPFSA